MNAALTDFQNRFFAFLSKLEERMNSFTNESVATLSTLYHEDESDHHQGYHRLKSAVLTQLASIQKKADDTLQEKINELDDDGPWESKASFYTLRSNCSDRLQQFQERYQACQKMIEATEQPDYETEYQEILSAYEAVKNQFRCSQCGGPIVINQLYFTSTYITCPACQTQNTFNPGSRAKQLEGLGRSLAEQRTAHLRQAYEAIPSQLQKIYNQIHALRLSLHQQNKTVAADTENQIAQLQREYDQLNESSPGLYEKYVHAMFDEWNKINPAMQAEHDRFRQRMIDDMYKYK